MKLVVLDRDGVINVESPEFIKSAAEWRPIAGSIEAIGSLSRAGWTVVVATNQSGIGRGLFGFGELAAIHARMLGAVAGAGGRIDGVFFCPHSPDVGCACRKPAPGLLHDIARYYGIELGGVWVVGDSARDLAAARAAGARPVLVRTGNGRDTEAQLGPGEADKVFDDLAAFVAELLAA